MSATFKEHALEKRFSAMAYILRRLPTLMEQPGTMATISAVCLNPSTVISTALRSASRNNAPNKFTATLNQVDTEGGCINVTPSEFVKTISRKSRKSNFSGLVMVAIDLGGGILLTHIEKAMDRYFHTFNLVDLNDFLFESQA